MKIFFALLLLPGIFLLCLLGCAAALCRYDRLDAWCARQLTDTDGQPDETNQNKPLSKTNGD